MENVTFFTMNPSIGNNSERLWGENSEKKPQRGVYVEVKRI